MPCRTPTRKEKELIGVEDDQNDNNPQVMASCLDKVAALKKKQHDQQQKMGFHHHQLTDDSRSQTLSMFRKYLCSKTQNSIVGKTIMEESEVIKKKHAATGRPLPPPKSGGHMPRQASLLEQKLLPGIRNEGMQSECDGKSSAAQLTIFYAGAINVYDNVPADKAQAIMLLAGESSMSKPVAVELPRIETKKSPLHCSNLTSVSKLQPGRDI
ncbi:uncharacterized protein LOC110642690 [Hevea brasiliensis]|uniref:uncharacterized protein LOC110642690 n=1 Tax=Hevea brasiliensis TaxID=3981 RepID=UPI0025EF5D99|nr:uncharacterized protein LOC110642690 [Hevea brasiliensis]